MMGSAIEWTDETWNPIRARYWEIQDDGSGKERIGWHCEHVSEGCRNCYAERINRVRGTGRDFKPGELYRAERKGYNNGESKLFLDQKTLARPLSWRKPRMVFPCSMTDMFADFVPDPWLDQMFAVMALAPQHTFQVLTKRPERMQAFAAGIKARHRVWDCADQIACDRNLSEVHPSAPYLNAGRDAATWPLPNIWLGVSAEDQAAADARIPILLGTPAAVRFLSAEPLLGPIDLRPFIGAVHHHPDNVPSPELDALIRAARDEMRARHPDAKCLDWVIAGGESGPNARPMHPDWARSIRDQCSSAGVAFFFKQWGLHITEDQSPEDIVLPGTALLPWSTYDYRREEWAGDQTAVYRVGKKRAGRMLDGRTWDQMPALMDSGD